MVLSLVYVSGVNHLQTLYLIYSREGFVSLAINRPFSRPLKAFRLVVELCHLRGIGTAEQLKCPISTDLPKVESGKRIDRRSRSFQWLSPESAMAQVCEPVRSSGTGTVHPTWHAMCLPSCEGPLIHLDTGNPRLFCTCLGLSQAINTQAAEASGRHSRARPPLFTSTNIQPLDCWDGIVVYYEL